MHVNLNSTFCQEFYPVKVRNAAMRYFNFVGRGGTFFSQIIYLALYYMQGPRGPFILSAVIIGVECVAYLFIPETPFVDEDDEPKKLFPTMNIKS